MVSNYRPISLLSIFNKILERLMYNRLIKYFEQSSIFFNQQFGFRSNHSAVHALILMVYKIQKPIDSCISIGQCKAFDAVDHHILLDKLEYYGIRGIANGFLPIHLIGVSLSLWALYILWCKTNSTSSATGLHSRAFVVLILCKWSP